MKIIVVSHNRNWYNNSKDFTLLNNISLPVVAMKADSALLKNGKPFFIPDFTKQCVTHLCLVVRISRLGKSISARFAPRYYDAITIGVDFRAMDVMKDLAERSLPLDLALSFDASAVIGDWIDINTDVKLGLCVASKSVEYTFGDIRTTINDMVEKLSKVFTLRQGDLLFMDFAENGIEVKIDDHIVGYVNEKKLLEFNVK